MMQRNGDKLFELQSLLYCIPQLNSYMCANLCYLPASSKSQYASYVTKHDKGTVNCCTRLWHTVSEPKGRVTIKLNVK